MQTENWQKVKELLDQVLNLDPDKRTKFLDEANIGKETLAEIESLMSFETEADHLMNFSAIELSKDFFADNQTSLIGQQIGVYQIIRELGYGGMGAVYLAERNDGKFEQIVALKMLKREMNTTAIRKRFQQEQQILASLEHPNIAHLLDVGTTDDKVPYLAMEYVEGLPIDDYCQNHQLNLNQRLDLFRKVCEAVNFAHRNLIVHRDLKPSNILINNEGNPKLLDFGISKILSSDFEQLDSATVTKLGVMTPGYASPEQLQSKSVTTATDIYSLGVILYELLSGHRPFEAKEHDLKEIYQAVLETDPTLPSLLVDTIVKELKAKTDSKSVEVYGSIDKPQQTNAGKIQQTTPNTIRVTSNSLRGDLDNIVLKALRKEPERRYSSVENLAEDIYRHQNGLPVTARPNTFSYRAEKFFQRNRVSVIAGMLFLVAVIGGVLATLWQMRATRLEAEKVKKINAYTQNILNFSNPHWLSSNPKRNREAKISDALDEALKNIDTDLANEPEIQAEVLLTLGQTYTSQGQFDKAEKILRRAIENFNQVLGKENLRSMQASVILGDVSYNTAKYQEAEQLYTKAVHYFRSHAAKDKSQTKWQAIAMNQLGNVQSTNGNYAGAIELFKESYEISETFSGKDRFLIPIALCNLGIQFSARGDYQTSLNYYRQALDEVRRAGNESTLEGGGIYLNLGIAYYLLDNYQEAEIDFKKSYEIYVAALGEDAIEIVAVLRQQALNQYKQGNFNEAERLAQKSMQICNKLFPGGHWQTASGERALGEIYTKKGELKKGEVSLRKGLDWFLKNTKTPNRGLTVIKALLGENLLAQGQYLEARELIQSAIEETITMSGENHPNLKQYRELLSKIPE